MTALRLWLARLILSNTYYVILPLDMFEHYVGLISRGSQATATVADGEIVSISLGEDL